MADRAPWVICNGIATQGLGMNVVNVQLVGWVETQQAKSTDIAGFANPAYALQDLQHDTGPYVSTLPNRE